MLLPTASTGVCLSLDPSSHHSYAIPNTEEKGNFSCIETAADGVDVVSFKTVYEKKVGIICAPKMPQYGECPLTDKPDKKNKAPIAIKDHCH